jgi:hypothetical protein
MTCSQLGMTIGYIRCSHSGSQTTRRERTYQNDVVKEHRAHGFGSFGPRPWHEVAVNVFRDSNRRVPHLLRHNLQGNFHRNQERRTRVSKLMDPPVIELVDVVERRPLDVLDVAPGFLEVNQRGLAKTVERFGQSLVIGICS